MTALETKAFCSVYGPVQSWRFGQSLGIDPIGAVSTCSFHCAYCQLGQIDVKTCDRQIFVSTQQIYNDLQAFAPWAVDTVTLSGSGEPTLALNLGSILTIVKAVTKKPVGVLTNGSLLSDAAVRAELAIADWVAVKVDAVNEDALRRINHPVPTFNFEEMWAGLLQFRQQYLGSLAIQTMLLTAWSEAAQADYIQRMQALLPDEIQLNIPSRPRPLTHQLDARGNHSPSICPYPAQSLKHVNARVLQTFSDRIESAIGIPVRYRILSTEGETHHATPKD